ncbi:MAG: 4-hydroxy-3-methylbut-2-enyl diphosphate reductase [Candidatus Woesearchaeota archaeon]
MTEVTVAKTAGFCIGVKNAIEMAFSAAKDDVYILGELVHNPSVVMQLEKAGVKKVDDYHDITKGSTLIIPSHGALLEVFSYCSNNGIRIVDATCSYVKNVQDTATMLAGEGYKVIIIGKKGHPEVNSIASRAADSIIVSSADEIPGNGKLAVVCQTTLTEEKLNEIKNAVINYKELRVYNSTCLATRKRQDDAKELSKKVDVMIVIGGKNSSNTQELKETCAKLVETHLVEDESELDPAWLNVKKVGVTAGASTPKEVIEKVVQKIEDVKNG